MLLITFATDDRHTPASWPSHFRLAPREFPTVRADVVDAPSAPLIDAGEWRRLQTQWNFDRSLDRFDTQPFRLTVSCEVADADRAAVEILNRAQRLIGRRNVASQSAIFDRLVALHRAMHDLNKPLVRSDYDHALDVWQWLLRLDSDASFELQAAALLHDIERLESEADVRIEQHAADYAGFKQQHATRGAAIAAQLLADAGASREAIERTTDLVAHHETPADDPDLALLNDADALSFFSFNSFGYFDYYGPEQGAKKVEYTVARLSARGRSKLDCIHLRDDARAALDRALTATSSR